MAFIGIDIGPSNPKTSVSPEIWGDDVTDAEVVAVALGDYGAWVDAVSPVGESPFKKPSPELLSWLKDNNLGQVALFLESLNPSTSEI